ncbi:MAG: hypothetical protein NVSMB59_07790 [Vulcanimicrobiaceae bacterium]
MRRTLKEPDLEPFVEQAIAEMRGLLRDAGVPEAGLPFTIVHAKVASDHAGEIEVCVPCTASDLDAGVVPLGTIVSTRGAVTDVSLERAQHAEIRAAYERIAEAILTAGFLLGPAPREHYDATGRIVRIVWPLGDRAVGEHAVGTHAVGTHESDATRFG